MNNNIKIQHLFSCIIFIEAVILDIKRIQIVLLVEVKQLNSTKLADSLKEIQI